MIENEELVKIIEKKNESFIRNDLIPFLKISSCTLNKTGIHEATQYIINYISEFCDDIQQIEGKVNPLIIAKVSGKIDNPLLIYMMYDTQPINDLDKWLSPPFQADIRKIPSLIDLGDCIIARGAYNSKTPLLSFLNIIKILKANDSLPISLYLIIDGEEEIGSPTFLKLLTHNKSLFKHCIDAYYPSTKQDLDGKAIIKLGYKGIISLSLKTHTKNQQIHSAYNNIVPNPTLDLLSLINVIFNDKKIQIYSLCNEYKLSKQDRELTENLASNENIDKIMMKAGISHLSINDPSLLFQDYLFKPTFNISTLKSGHLKQGIKNSIPNSASCNIDIRFAHQLSTNTIFEEIEEIISLFSKNIISKVEIIRNNGLESSRVNRDSILIKSILKSFNKLEIQSEIWPISAAASPVSKIQSELGIDYLAAGLGIGGNAHSINEFIKLDSIINARISYFYFLVFYSKIKKIKKK
ncbi:MAG: M20/M25/M40 family metallo-hydrolase [Candidatus Lokiarchaeota archaeon]|nr:M20/M25/M40 family metallo-hydrolase [Candidatus Lokiarchaeota archaeon]